MALALAAAGGFATIEALKDISAGGSGLRAAIEAEKQVMMDAGLTPKTTMEDGKFVPSAILRNPDGSARQINLFDLPANADSKLPGPSLLGRAPKPGNMQEGSLRNAKVDLNLSDPRVIAYLEKHEPEALKEYMRVFNNYKLRIKRLTKEKEQMNAEIKAVDDNKELSKEEKDERKLLIRAKYNQKYIDQYGNPSTFQNLFGVNQPTNETLESTTGMANMPPAEGMVNNPQYGRISPISAVDPLPIGSVVNHIRLPDKFETVSANQPVKSGTEIPDFKVVNPYPHRSKVTDALGIGYLVG